MKNILTIVLCLLFNKVCFAQTSVVFDKIDQSNGLSNGTVNQVIQDKMGFMWFATQNGLNRYDGHEFKVFNILNSELKTNDIQCLFQEGDEKIWIGTAGGGLSIYDLETEEFETFIYDPDDQSSISANVINDIYKDHKGQYWIGTVGGLNLFNPKIKKFTRFTYQKKNPYAISHDNIRKIMMDDQGMLWIGTYGGGLNRFDQQENRFYHIKPTTLDAEINISHIRTMLCVSPDKFLIGTNNGDLLEYNPVNNLFSPYFSNESLNVSIVRKLFIDHKDRLWIATDGEGVIVTNLNDPDRAMQQYVSSSSIQNSLSNNAVYDVFEDHSNNIWIATAWKGINVLRNNDNQISHYYSDFLGSNTVGVLSLYKNDKKLWFGTDGDGLSIYDYGLSQQSHLGKKEGNFAGAYIQTIKNDPDDPSLFWIGTFKNGLIAYHEDQGYKHYQTNPDDSSSISNNNIRDILKISDSDYLIASWGGGLNLLDASTGKFKLYQHDENDSNSISSNNVISLLEAGNGKIWITTFGGGLNLFDPATETFTAFLHDKEDARSISGNNLVSILKDQQGDLWIGTWGNGLVKFNVRSLTFEKLDFNNYQNPGTVVSMLEDEKGNIWLGTKSGIYCYDTASGKLHSFQHLSGEFHINAAFKDQEGKFYFGNTKGVISFHPDNINIESESNQVLFTGIKLYNQPVRIDGKLLSRNVSHQKSYSFAHDQNVLTFEFAALNYPFSSHNKYAVKLDNFSDEWIELNNQRSVTFSNLAPGEYELFVRTTGNNNWDNAASSSLAITIHKPWWTQWWAFTLYAIFFMVLLYTFRHFIVNWEKMKNSLKLEKLSHEKDAELHNLKLKFFTNISHEIRTPLTLILGAINRMDDTGIVEKKHTNYLSIIRKNGNHLLHLVNELLDFRKLETAAFSLKVSEGDFVKFSKEVFLSFQGRAMENQIKFNFNASNETIRLWYDKDQMEKVLYNLLSNAFKFTDAHGKIDLTVDADDENVFLRIADTGKGISKKNLDNIFKRFYQSENALQINESGTGLGLSITNEIVKLHSGQIAIESQKNVGTTVVVKLLMGKEHFSPNQIISWSTDSDLGENYVRTENLEQVEDHIEPLTQDEYKLLIVEDNEWVREYIVDLLSADYSISVASNGVEALEQINEQMPDLVLCDVIMPEMDGITLTEKIKSNKKTSHIPVIILTARTSLIYKKEGYETGADAYITKPFSETLLKTRIKRILKNQDLFREKLKNEFITQPKELAINTPDQQFLEDLINIIDSNIDNSNLKVGFISKELAMSHSVVYKKIKSLTGLSLIEFIRDYRLKRAAQLISVHQLNIADACFRVGFSDRKYFSQIFKIKFGMTPTEYIKSKQN